MRVSVRPFDVTGRDKKILATSREWEVEEEEEDSNATAAYGPSEIIKNTVRTYAILGV